MQLRLNNRQNARRSLARLIRDFASAPDADPEVDRLTIDRFRAAVYGLSQLLAYDRAAEELAIADRLDAIESRLDAADEAAR